jgi:hypothetical protein
VSAQDQDRVADLIAQLGAQDFDARVRAEQELIRIGSPALEALGKAMQSSDAEVSQRAWHAVEEIRRNMAVAEVIKAGTRVTLELRDATLEEAAAALGAAAGLQARVPDSLKERKVSLLVKDAELLRALDTLCRGLKDVNYRFEGAAVVEFVERPFVDYPAAYFGPFKVQIQRIRTTTENEITRSLSELELSVQLVAEPGVKTGDPSLRVAEAFDEAGKKLEPLAEAPAAPSPMQSVSSMTINGRTIRIVSDGTNTRVIREGETPSEPGARTVSFRNIPGAPSRLSSLKLQASFSIPSVTRHEVVFENPKDEDTRTAGNLEAEIADVASRHIELVLRSKDGARVGTDLLDRSSVVIKSGDTDYEAKVVDQMTDTSSWDPRDARKMLRDLERMMSRGPQRDARFYIAIPEGAREKGVETLKFSVREYVSHAVTFEFKDLKLR